MSDFFILVDISRRSYINISILDSEKKRIYEMQKIKDCFGEMKITIEKIIALCMNDDIYKDFSSLIYNEFLKNKNKLSKLIYLGDLSFHLNVDISNIKNSKDADKKMTNIFLSMEDSDIDDILFFNKKHDMPVPFINYRITNNENYRKVNTKNEDFYIYRIGLHSESPASWFYSQIKKSKITILKNSNLVSIARLKRKEKEEKELKTLNRREIISEWGVMVYE
jgi:hypothetical protein